MNIHSPDSNREIFDAAAQAYSQEIEKSFGPIGVEHAFFVRHKAQIIIEALDTAFPGRRKQSRVLDIGCGIGMIHPHLEGEIGAMTGVDVSEHSLDIARAANPGVTYLANEGAHLPVASDLFDCATVVSVMHHVPPDARSEMLAEVHRALRPGGMVIIVEHNPYNPATRWIVGRCPLDRDAQLLSPRETKKALRNAGFTGIAQRHVLFTPLEAPLFRRLDAALAWLPLGAQYVTIAKRPES